jgi:hypothetical protein
MITNDQWRTASSRVLTVHQGWEATACTAAFRGAPSPLAGYEGTTLPAAGFAASGLGVQAEVVRMAVVDRDRITRVPGVLPRGAPV